MRFGCFSRRKVARWCCHGEPRQAVFLRATVRRSGLTLFSYLLELFQPTYIGLLRRGCVFGRRACVCMCISACFKMTAWAAVAMLPSGHRLYNFAYETCLACRTTEDDYCGRIWFYMWLKFYIIMWHIFPTATPLKLPWCAVNWIFYSLDEKLFYKKKKPSKQTSIKICTICSH